MAKQLNMSTVKESNKIYSETVDIELTVGNEEYIVKFLPFFSPITVNKMLLDIGEFLTKSQEEKLDVKDSEFDDILGYFIVKHFTNIKFSQSKKAKSIYSEYNEAKNSKLFDIILKSVPEESMKYVYEKIFERQEMVSKLQGQLELAQKKLKDYDFTNKEVKDLFVGKLGDENSEGI